MSTPASRVMPSPLPSSRRRAAGLVAATVAAATLVATTGTTAVARGGHEPDDANGFAQVNLVSDLPETHPLLIDENVKNPWGIASGPTSPLWVSNNFNPASDCGSNGCIPAADTLITKVTLYKGANGHDPFMKVPLEVTASAPTGVVFNPTTDFAVRQGGVRAPATFLFNEAVPNASATGPQGEVTGWTKAATPLPTDTVVVHSEDGAFYTGLTIVPGNGHRPSLLLSADSINGSVDAFTTTFREAHLRAGAFVDPSPDAGTMTPYNVAYLKHRVYVTYSPNSPDGSGDSAVSVFSRTGRFVKRLITGAPLAAPWGLAVAPRNWGEFGRALLVGNVNDGRINAFDRHTGRLLGTLSDSHGAAIENPGLWGLQFGNGVIGTPNDLIFAAGIGSEANGFGDVYLHGLVGLIHPVDEEEDDD